MSSARDPRRHPGSEHEPRGAQPARTVAVACAVGLAFGLLAACADVGPAHARTAPPAEPSTGAPPSETDPGAPRASAGDASAEPDLGLPTQRTVGAPGRDAPLALDLPTKHVARDAGAETPRASAAAPNAKSATPRVVDRVRVSVRDQRLQVLAGREVVREYPVSTAKNGVGAAAGSQRTPLGLHRVHSKFGAGEPLGMVFEARRPTGKLARIHTAPVDLPEDVITTRVLWLEGLEAGKNRGAGVDSHARFIYIHGTNEEGLIGQPASHGCVRMRNRDVLELFDLVAAGTHVEILE